MGGGGYNTKQDIIFIIKHLHYLSKKTHRS